ncbi:MAG: hypothetical protein ACAI35_13415 [Candidatus Methylacidiphilales bacterium]
MSILPSIIIAGIVAAALSSFDAYIAENLQDTVALLFRARTRLALADGPGAEADFTAAAALDGELAARFRNIPPGSLASAQTAALPEDAA